MKIERVASDIVNVTSSELANALKKYLQCEISRKSDRILNVTEVFSERCNYTVEDFYGTYGATTTITLIEYTNPKQVQFKIPNQSTKTDNLEKLLRSGKLLKAIEKYVAKYFVETK